MVSMVSILNGTKQTISKAYGDLVASYYHSFFSMEKSLSGVKIVSKANYENWPSQFFENRNKKFWESGIMKLPSKWQQVRKIQRIFEPK